jgi:ATP-dependent Lon protease
VRLDKLLELLARRIEVLKVSRDVDERTRESIGDMNRKHLLREQMRQIQKELGEEDEGKRSSRTSRSRSAKPACPRRSRRPRARS